VGRSGPTSWVPGTKTVGFRPKVFRGTGCTLTKIISHETARMPTKGTKTSGSEASDADAAVSVAVGDDPASIGSLGSEIGSIRASATYELVVEQLRRAIYLGRFLPGDKLPAERELAHQLAVSRTTIREAIRVLEGEGLVTIKRGAAGGLIVLGQPKLTPAQIEAYMETQHGLVDSVFEFRLANECAAAALAAQRRTDEHLRRMERAVVEMAELCATPMSRQRVSNIARFTASDSAFHMAIAQASMNPLLLKAVEDGRAAMFEPVGRVFTRLEDSANDHHEALFIAIKDGQPESAAARMREHIEASRAGFHALFPNRKRRTAQTR
jgi:GntR family transcriptional repressor for pyruvate dehydrogenase complex